MKTGHTTEKGREYVTPVVEFLACAWCTNAVPVRAAGRRPRFCSPDCRRAEHRARRRVDAAYTELLDAEEALKRGGAVTTEQSE